MRGQYVRLLVMFAVVAELFLQFGSTSSRVQAYVALPVSTVYGPQPQPPINPVEPQACQPDPERNLVGALVAPERAQVTNTSTACSYSVGIAAYRKFDSTVDRQEIADWQMVTIAPSASTEFRVTLPGCAVQVDVFYGPVLLSLDGRRYGERLLASRHIMGSGYCQPIVPTCVVYATKQQGNNDSVLLALDLREQQAYPIGATQDDTDLQGIAIHPKTEVLYTVSGTKSVQPGHLYSADRSTGTLAAIGATGFTHLSALAFRPSDASLWGWDKGTGLVQIDPRSGAASLYYPSQASAPMLPRSTCHAGGFRGRRSGSLAQTPAS